MNDQPQQDGRRARVKYGPKPHQTISHEHAEQILMDLAGRQPGVFGTYLRRIIVAELPHRGQHDGVADQ